jgi:hypothetical protein
VVSELMPEAALLEPPDLQGVRYIQQVLIEVKERLRRQQKLQSVPQSVMPSSKTDQTAYRCKMEQYLASGDPILMAEARRCLAATQERVPQEPASFTQSDTQSERRAIADDAVYAADCSEVLAQISIYRRCLGWTATQVQAALQQLFGRISQALLTDAELTVWLRWLSSNLTSSRTSFPE